MTTRLPLHVTFHTTYPYLTISSADIIGKSFSDHTGRVLIPMLAQLQGCIPVTSYAGRLGGGRVGGRVLQN